MMAAQDKINNPKISIIIPAYNVGEFVGQCLDSILNQSFKDFEIIIVDDGSKDNTPLIIQKYSEKDSRIKFIKQENKGVSNARNKAIEQSKGEYISFIDADDWISEGFFEKLLNALENSSCDIACASVIRKGKNKNKYRLNFTQEKIITTLKEKIEILKIPFCCYIWAKLYKADLVKQFNFKEGVFFEDMIYLPQIIKKAKNIITVPDIIYFYRVNKNSIVKKLPSFKKQQDCYEAKKFIVEFFKENNLDLDEKEKNITKRIFYLFKIPILKIKEKDNINTCYLFSFLPVYKFKND